MARAQLVPPCAWGCLLMAAFAVVGCGGGGSDPDSETVPETRRDVNAPSINFAGEFSEPTRERIELEADLAITILNDLFGVRPQWTSVTFASSREALESAYAERTGSELPDFPNCFADLQPDGRILIFIAFDQCGVGYTAGDRAGSVLAHEYFHAIQYSLSRTFYGTPAWLVEGSAEYATARLGDETGSLPYPQFRSAAVMRTASWTGSLRDAEGDDSHWPGYDDYFLGFLAVDYLADRAGEESLIMYFRSLPSRWEWGWERAFRDAFGRDVETFHDDFERHRQELVAGVLTIQGQVTWTGSEPARGVTLRAVDEFETREGWGESAPDGTFSIALRQRGNYRVEVYVLDDLKNCNLAGWLAEGGGFSVSGENLLYVEAEKSVSGIDIRLPDEIEPRPFAGYCFP